MKLLYLLTTVFLFFINLGCSTTQSRTVITTKDKAEIVSVSVSGEESNYKFTIGISSPDVGCEQYADWWEIISEDGATLIYRRVLGHSHVNEQPFIRSGKSVSISRNQTIIIRAHMNNSGYGVKVYKGSVSGGFIKSELPSNFAYRLAIQSPLPSRCTS